MASDVGSNQSVERALTVLRRRSRPAAPSCASPTWPSPPALASPPPPACSRPWRRPGSSTATRSAGSTGWGLDAVSLAGAVLNSHPVHREARQIAQNLAADLGLGVNVAVRRDASLFYLLNFEGRPAPRAFVLAGQRNPLHATGLGKSLLTGG